MGAARKHRLALIKGGKADVAKTVYAKPIRLVTETHLFTPELSNAITERYEKQVSAKAKEERLPTRSSFFEALVVAGMASFDQHVVQAQAKESLIALATPGDAAEMTKGIILG